MGHVFVVHGDLLKISADEILIPCDRSGDVNQHWGEYGQVDRPALQRELDPSRVSSVRAGDDILVRYVDTGAWEGVPAAWLGEGVRAGLDAGVGDLVDRAGSNGRAHPLIAIPVFGVGDGGFDSVRGEALQVQLRAATEAVADHEVDVAIVCFKRSDFASLQLQREPSNWNLPDELSTAGDDLAAAVRAGRLVLFLGAGVSVAAGIADFASLVTELEARHGSEPDNALDLPQRVQRLSSTLADGWMNAQVKDLVRRDHYSLTHGLLASLRVREAITTNFDDLYEQACERPFADERTDGPRAVEVLPWERSAAARPWLLKAHGDPNRPGELVLSADSFTTFEADRPSVAGVVRAMFALSREVFFVGYSLNDQNIKKLVDEAAQFHRAFGVQHAKLGTIVDLTSTTVEPSENPARLGLRAAADEPISLSARRLQILLDYVVWRATKDEAAWLLDHRYRALLTSDAERERAKELADGTLPGAAPWPALDASLQQFGRRPG